MSEFLNPWKGILEMDANSLKTKMDSAERQLNYHISKIIEAGGFVPQQLKNETSRIQDMSSTVTAVYRDFATINPLVSGLEFAWC